MSLDSNNPITSQSALFLKAGQPFDNRAVNQPVLKSGEVLVRVTCCTVCGSDLHTFQGRRSCPSPCVLGHEIIGRIVGWGGGTAPNDVHGKPLTVGQRVTWALAVGCGDCFYCTNDIPQKCTSLFKYGHEAVNEVLGATGGLTEFCHLMAGTSTFPLPDDLPDLVAAPANCATATVAGALRLAAETQPLSGKTAIVTGLGLLGLTACAMLRESGIRNVVAVDTAADRVELSQSFGASHMINVTKPDNDVSAVIKELTEGRGADFAFELSGANSGVETCLSNLRIGGTAILVGSVFPGDAIEVHPEDVVRRMLTIRGLHNYQPGDLSTALNFLSDHHRTYPFDKLVSESFELSESNQAFEYAIANKPVRVAVVP